MLPVAASKPVDVPVVEAGAPKRVPVLVPFVCPICTAQNGVQLIAISRAGGVNCSGCKKWLRAADVMRAMHSPRKTA